MGVGKVGKSQVLHGVNTMASECRLSFSNKPWRLTFATFFLFGIEKNSFFFCALSGTKYNEGVDFRKEETISQILDR